MIQDRTVADRRSTGSPAAPLSRSHGPYPIATFEATDAKQLRREFERSIDEYLAWCEEDGVEPRKPFSGKLNVRLGSELHAAVAAAARGMSINAWIVQVLRETAGAATLPA